MIINFEEQIDASYFFPGRIMLKQNETFLNINISNVFEEETQEEIRFKFTKELNTENFDFKL